MTAFIHSHLDYYSPLISHSLHPQHAISELVKDQTESILKRHDVETSSSSDGKFNLVLEIESCDDKDDDDDDCVSRRRLEVS